MYDENLGYAPASPDSIEEYAKDLEDKTFLEVMQSREIEDNAAILAYANKLRKGGLGNLLEEVYFGYKANSNQEADFADAGVELKTTPYEVTKKGELRAGEHLVLTCGFSAVEFYNPKHIAPYALEGDDGSNLFLRFEKRMK